MKRIAILSAAMGLMGAMANAGRDDVTIERARPVSGNRIRIATSKRQKRRSKYMPHQGAKERERAKRCYMVGGILQQMSRRQYEANFREVD